MTEEAEEADGERRPEGVGNGEIDRGAAVVSLFLEGKLLRQARALGGPSGRSSVVTAVIVVSAFGASLAVYGLVLTFLGAPGYGGMFYVLCAVHGLHLLIWWPRYGRALV